MQAFTQSQLQERIKLVFPVIRDFKEATFCAMDEEKSLKISEKENSGPKQQ